MSASNGKSTPTTIYDFTCTDIKGEPVSLEKYRDHVCIIVNVASKCGFTDSNYRDLVDLYDQYSDSKGLRILAFPCNQFGSQEPGTADDICEFAAGRRAKFDLFEKVDVNGSGTDPLWAFLKSKQGGLLGSFIKWNFTKFVVDKEGKPVARFAPTTNPKDMLSTLEKYW